MNYESICRKAIAVITETGNYIQEQQKSFSSDSIETKSLNSLVSFVDKSAEQQLVKGLRDVFPDAGFITEEETINDVRDEFNWVIDPLDGTTNFMHGIPVYSISVALMQNNYPVIGIIYEMNRDEMFYSWKGGKAFLNDKTIQVSSNTNLSDSLLATGFPYHDFEKMDQFLSSLKYFMCNTRGLRRMGSAAVDLAYVACGRFDSFYEYGLNIWDVAAGAFLVEQAGGVAGYFTRRTVFTDGSEILASNPHLHPVMLNKMKEFYNL